MQESFHPLASKKQGSNSQFGYTFAIAFILLGLWPFFQGGEANLSWLAVSGVLALVAWRKPGWLEQPNRLWSLLGDLLAKIVSPIMLGVLFFGVITPMGVLMRAFGKDPLRLKKNPGADTYWLPRSAPSNPPDSFNNQF